MFRDRIEAGKLLADKLSKFKGEDGVVLAVPRGGIPVACEVAKELDFPIELVLSKKIGHPSNKEYAIGVASLNDYFISPHQHVTELYIKEEVAKLQKRLRVMHQQFMGDKKPMNLEGKTVIIVDDGVATGNTLLGTISLLRKRKPDKIIIAVPVGPKDTIIELSKRAEEAIVLEIPEIFYAVGYHYEDFKQVSNEEVMSYLNRLEETKKSVK